MLLFGIYLRWSWFNVNECPRSYSEASICARVCARGENGLDVLRTADASYKVEVILCSTHGRYSEKISHLAPGHRRKGEEDAIQQETQTQSDTP